MSKNKKGFAMGAIVLMIFGLISKAIGALYRIPLTSIIGTEGMGLYQMVFPLYTLMLTISSSGLPSSISKLISENIAKNNYKQANRILKVSFLLLVCFSILCTTIVFVFARTIAGLQGNFNAQICYYAVAPSIMFVGLIAGFRGYFQGFQCMYPSAISGFIEQVIKMVFGLFFASLFIKNGTKYGVLGALVGITISELITLVYLFLTYLFKRKKARKLAYLSEGAVLSVKDTAKKILSLSILVTLGGLIMPLTMLIDSAVVINILKAIGITQMQATSLFGIQTGTVGSIINMPVVLSLSVATAILPCVSAKMSSGDIDGAKESCSRAILLTIILALPSAVGCFTFAEPIIKLLYGRSLTLSQIEVATSLLEIASIGIFYLALLQVSSGLLQGLGKFKIPLISLGIGGTVKILLNLALIRVPQINILGAEVATVACYLVALLINLFTLKRHKVINLDYKVIFVVLLSFLIYFAKFAFEALVDMTINYYLALFLVVIFVVAIYFFFVVILYKGKHIRCKLLKK